MIFRNCLQLLKIHPQFIFPRFISKVKTAIEKNCIIPDVIDESPDEAAKVQFECGARADLGNILLPTQVKHEPFVKYPCKDDCLYTVCMTDPDAPSRSKPQLREWLHWLVINISGSNVREGEYIAEYIGAGPPKGTGLHRYVVLVYQQKEKISYVGEIMTNKSPKGRNNFLIKTFAKKYHLQKLIAINFFQAEYDDYVPILHKQLGLKSK